MKICLAFLFSVLIAGTAFAGSSFPLNSVSGMPSGHIYRSTSNSQQPSDGGVLGTIASQSASSVAITGGSITGTSISGSTGSFTSITGPTLIGGSATSSTLTLRSTSGVGATDSVNIVTGNGVATAGWFTNQSANTYVPTTGSPVGAYLVNVGGQGLYGSYGIGPKPDAGQMVIAASYADSTSGNISNIYANLSQSGTRYAAAITGTALNTSSGGSVWGLQGIGVCASAGSFCNGAQLEAESGTGAGINANALILSTGCYAGTCGASNVPTNSYISMISNSTGTSPYNQSAPYDMIAINDSGVNPLQTTGSVLRNYGTFLSAQYGINFNDTATFSRCAFRSLHFCIDGSGLIASTYSDANKVQITSALTTVAPTIAFTGTDSNVSGSIATKGTGALFLSPSGLTSVKWLSHTSAVNILIGQSRETGVPYQLFSSSDAGIDFGVAGHAAAQSVYFQSDMDGSPSTMAELKPTASGINHFRLTPGPTGTGPTLDMQPGGADANASFNLGLLGTGSYNFFTRGTSKQQFAILDNPSGADYITVTSGASAAFLSTNAGDLTFGTAAAVQATLSASTGILTVNRGVVVTQSIGAAYGGSGVLEEYNSTNGVWSNMSGSGGYAWYNNGTRVTQLASLSSTGVFNALLGFSAAGVPGASCTASSVSLSTEVVTDGIVTHC